VTHYKPNLASVYKQGRLGVTSYQNPDTGGGVSLRKVGVLTTWHCYQPDKILLNSVPVKASRHIQQDRQCTCNITMRCGHANIVCKSSKYYLFWGCGCSLRYPAWYVSASYCHLWPAWLYNILSILTSKWHDFWSKKNIEHKMCFWICSTTFVRNIFHSKKNWAWYDH